MSFLKVTNLSFSYLSENSKEKPFEVLKNINLTINQGDYLVITGENGSGKSTLARIIAGFLTPTQGEIFGDAYRTETTQTKNEVPSGIIYQRPENQIVSSIVKKDTSFGPENLNLSTQEINQRVEKALSLTELLSIADQNTQTLSSGQKQRLALSGIFALNPQLLILDEAVTMIDIESRKAILSFIDNQHKKGTTVISITHNKDEASRGNRLIFLQNGEIYFDGVYKDFVAQNNFFSFEPKTFTPQTNDEIILTFDKVSFGYKKDDFLFEDATFALKKGTLTALTGRSGMGKTTLMEIATGLLPCIEGSVKAKSRPVLAQQDCSSSLFEEFVADDVAYGPALQGIKGKELKERVKNALNSVGLPFEEFANKRISELSGGQKRKVSLAGIIALDSPILFFDEPTAGLDPKSKEELFLLFKTLCNQGKSVIFSTHRQEEVFVSHNWLNIQDKKVIVEKTSLNAQNFINSTEEQNLETILPLQNTSILTNLDETKNKKDKNNSFVSKLSPLAKYIILLLFMCTGIGFSSVLPLCVVCVLLFVYAKLANLSVVKLLKTCLLILPWILFFFVLQMLFFPAKENDLIYWQFSFITITNSKILLGIKTILHYIAVLIAITVFLSTTDETEILDGMKSLLKPLSILRIPTRHIVLLTGIVFRFLPMLKDEASQITKAQLIRSCGKLNNTKKKKFLQKVYDMLPLFVPLIVRTLKRAESLAEALEARYYK